MVRIRKNPRIFQARRRRRIARRRGEILTAAARVFAEKGYAGTTTKEIADAADVAEGTLYNYFGSKREILLAIVGEMQATMETVLQGAEKIQGREDMIALVEKAYGDLVSRLPFIRTFLTEAWVDDAILENFVIEYFGRMAQRVRGFIVKRIEAGVFRPVDSALAARMMLGMLAVPIFPALRGVTEPPSPEECHALAKAAVGLLLDGICVRERNSAEES